MRLICCVFGFFLMLNGSSALANDSLKNAVTVYQNSMKSLCAMLLVEQKMVSELDQVAKKMDLNAFMNLRTDDTSIPLDIRKHADKVTQYSSEMQTLAREIPKDELQRVSENLSPKEIEELRSIISEQLKKQCNLGDDPWKKGRVGQWLVKSTNAHQLDSIEKEAKAGNSTAKYVLGSMLVRGEKVQQNCKTGIEWLKKASADGISDASMALARMYKDGFLCNIQDEAQSAQYQAAWEHQSK